MRAAKRTKHQERHATLTTRPDGTLRLAVVADTHSAPHPALLELLRERRPDAILHAGDIGDLAVLDALSTVSPVLAVRGNIDVHARDLPDVLVLDVVRDAPSARLALRVLMTHIGVYGPKLRAEVARRAMAHEASLVVCGHSHVPFIGRERGLALFNPGSAGPRRFRLPIVFGIIDLSADGVHLRHVSCETGRDWTPTLDPAL
ncbi:MAG TPA: metallophosphoesterase family protein [Polyangiaceae bacterium]|nr:metallophosphoesterase family protein [Polyangiaceae bacterium]